MTTWWNYANVLVNANSVTYTKEILTVGLKDLGLTERILWEPDVTLKKTIQVGQAAEEIKRQTKKVFRHSRNGHYIH